MIYGSQSVSGGVETEVLSHQAVEVKTNQAKAREASAHVVDSLWCSDL